MYGFAIRSTERVRMQTVFPSIELRNGSIVQFLKELPVGAPKGSFWTLPGTGFEGRAC